jgi:hypothetical protein
MMHGQTKFKFICWVKIIYQLLALCYRVVQLPRYVPFFQKGKGTLGVPLLWKHTRIEVCLMFWQFIHFRYIILQSPNTTWNFFSIIHQLKYEGASLQSLTQLNVFCARIFQKIKEMGEGGGRVEVTLFSGKYNTIKSWTWNWTGNINQQKYIKVKSRANFSLWQQWNMW